MTTERSSSDTVTENPQQQDSDLLTDNTTEEQLQTEVEQGLSEGAKKTSETGVSEDTNQGAETTEVSDVTTTTETEETRNYSHGEVSKIQSSYDKRAADNEKTIGELKTELNTLKDQTQTQTQQYSDQQIIGARDSFIRDKAQWLVEQGVEQQAAHSQAQQEGNAAANTAMNQIKLDQERQYLDQAKAELNRQAKVTATSQIGQKYNVPVSELNSFSTPEQMEKYAAAVSQTNKVVKETTPQLNTSGDVPPDHIPTNDEDILDRFAAGDPKITMGMYEQAQKRMNPNWNG